MRLNVAFCEDLQPQNVIIFFILHQTFKQFSLIFIWYEGATVDNSMHVKRNFCCPFSVPTKLMYYVYVM